MMFTFDIGDVILLILLSLFGIMWLYIAVRMAARAVVRTLNEKEKK